MNLAEVKTRLEREIRHVQMELNMENIEHIVGGNNIPKDKEKQETIDLSQMWEEYMARHIARFERKGVDWLTDQLSNALKLYQVGLENLETAEEAIKKEKAGRQAKIESLRETRIKKANLLKEAAKKLQGELSKAETASKDEENKFLVIKGKVDALAQDQRPAARKSLGFFKQVSAKTAAAQVYHKKQVQYGKIQRDIIALDEKELPVTIKRVRAEVDQLKAFQTVVKKMDSDLKVKEAGLELGNISIGKRMAANVSS